MNQLVKVRNQLQKRKRQGAPKGQLDELLAKLNSLNEPCSLKGLDYVRCHTYENNWLKPPYVIIDNEYDGNCFFAAIRNAYILSGTALPTEGDYIKYLRGLLVGEELAGYMDSLKELGPEILESIRIPPEVFENNNRFKEFILSNNYWADEWAIQRISHKLSLSIIIMSKEYGTDCRYVNADYPNAIILEYSDRGQHYRLIGYDGKFMFKLTELPVACKRAMQMPRIGTVKLAKQGLADRPSVLPRQPIFTGANVQQLKKNFMKKKEQVLELINRGRTMKLRPQDLQKIESFRAYLRNMKNKQQAKAVQAELDAASALAQLDATLAAKENIPSELYMSTSGYQQVQPRGSKEQQQSQYIKVGLPQQAQQAQPAQPSQSQYMMVDPNEIRQAQQAQQAQRMAKQQAQRRAKQQAQQAQRKAKQQAQNARLAQQAQKARLAQQQRRKTQQAQNKPVQQTSIFAGIARAATGFLTGPTQQKRQQPVKITQSRAPSLDQQLASATVSARHQQQDKNILSQEAVISFINNYYSKAAKCYTLGKDNSGLYCPTQLSRRAIQSQKGVQRRQQVRQPQPLGQRKAKQQSQPQPQAQRLQAQRKAKQQAQRLQAQRKAKQQAQRLQAQRKAKQQAQRLQAQRMKAQQDRRRAQQKARNPLNPISGLVPQSQA